jgi:hypothetical protein
MCPVECLLEIGRIDGVVVARPHPFILEGITKQTQDCIPLEGRNSFVRVIELVIGDEKYEYVILKILHYFFCRGMGRV